MTSNRRKPEPSPLTSAPLTTARLSLPPEDLPGVVIMLNVADSLLLLDWMNKSADNLEQAMAEDHARGEPIEDITVQMITTMAVGMQSCHSAAAASAIYDNSEPRDRNYFIHFTQHDAIIILQMLESTESEVARELHHNIIAQVDNAFRQKTPFANLPE